MAILTLNKDFRGTKNINKNKESTIGKIYNNFKYAFS